jgi:hypothetical protein
MMYMLLVYDGELRRCADDGVSADVTACLAVIGHGARVMADYVLQPSHAATTVVCDHGGPVTSDGLFVTSREPLSRLCLVEMRDLDDVLLLARELVRVGTSIEVRPMVPAS